MYLQEIVALATSKFGEPARYFFRVVQEDGQKRAQAEVFTSLRAGANVEDAFKQKCIKASAPFIPLRHDEAGKILLDPSRDEANAKLVELLEALP